MGATGGEVRGDVVVSAEELADQLVDALCGDERIDISTVRSVRTFAAAGLLTTDPGVVIRFRDGEEFQLTIVQSKVSP